MPEKCLVELENAIIAHLPAFVRARQRTDDQLFSVRPHFYDTHAPECYLYCAFTYRKTAEDIIKQSGETKFFELWSYGEECGDHWEVFPDQSCEMDELMASCYRFLCDDDQAYSFYAYSICYAAWQLNKKVQTLFKNVHPCFSIVPAEAQGEVLDDADALNLSLPDELVMQLHNAGFINLSLPKFGMAPEMSS